ncbi:hypothetical protein [Streptomyces sp. NL15-2K]|uniref:hypothetical protein n=1 Tax=Streptomyces sp. NL15-2K TaxID=376149 RepID=UPI000F581C15|nr:MULTISPECIES: hypothetical protein [Actinomycetes]WKX10410.1 hypothetical protein Q4V64_24030 [Kutzneria buriramensis]GCB48083.1 hypothetical protein SNL152K_5406 [Streptomyces sp. NL15-2K]
MAEIMTTDRLGGSAARCPLNDEELDQGSDVLTKPYALAGVKIRPQGLLSPAEPVRGQSARGR